MSSDSPDPTDSADRVAQAPKPASPPSPKGLPSWLFFAGLGAVVLAAGLIPRGDLSRWVYHRSAILDGELWRLVTGHFVHGSTLHLVWNLAALAIIGLALGRFVSFRGWLTILAGSIVAIDLGLLALSPEVPVVAGLSGALHGLWAGAAGVELGQRRPAGWVLLGALVVKVGWDLVGGTIVAGAVLGSRIAAEAHLCGAVGGFLGGLLNRLLNRGRI